TMFNMITVMIAPVEAMATSPKLSFSDALLSFFNAETPMASAKMKGTVNAPVVAPEASNEMARNSGEVKRASTRIMKYKIIKSLYKGMLNTILARPTAINAPMPMDTTMTITPFDMTP